MTFDDPVFIPDIAKRLGVDRNQVDQWRHRGHFPPADLRIGHRPAWRWSRVETWANKNLVTRTVRVLK
jgi:predicted DNA-binding transcriptional regulator AlpA